ncbi:alkylhydroperoxidase AhpD family core domain-containing protein [Tistlia consotensis]|uniref:Alkylhydroperoxidase AhpD family core domain-containing protein n=1 Tax=Tistlia consotensis USBA 355 TaxID=560819 RepID=A0A1Y6B880_9PROT|nr:carboxymuconolactone decarboxylase family protein [Tistlia consotensis]SME89473.1 alkylhydroperoxidase AhpD family core domain-containing protein [Tistlia consotensis USBA 355]SNR26000.1 alkylhydroperoxidase AhpD family core domain-containing protein [Tistlia consotensis]
MTTTYRETAQAVSDGAKALTELVPDAMAGFAALGKGAYKDGALSRQTKELIALALGIAAHCDGCVAYHARTLAQLKATREQVGEAIAVAVQMGGGPSMVYGGEALRAFDSFTRG